MDDDVEVPIRDWPHKSIIKAHRKAVYCTQFNCSGDLVATGSADQSIKLWTIDDTLSLKTEAELHGHTDAVTNISWHPTSPYKLASISSSGDKSVRFWDSRTGKNTAALNLSAPNLYLAWSPSGDCLAVGNRQDLVSIIDIRKLKVSEKYPYKQQINALSWGANGALFFQATGSGATDVYKWPEMKCVTSMTGHTAAVVSLAMDPQEKYIATGGADAVACLWDAAEFICLKTYYKMDQPIRSLGFSHDSRYLMVGGEQAALDVENIETGVSLGRLSLTRSPEDCAWHPKRLMLVHGGDATSDTAATLRWQPTSVAR